MKLALLFLLASLPLFAQDPDPHEKATVYIYRLRVYAGSKRRMTLSLDGERFAYLQNGRYLVLHLPPGKHVLADKDPEFRLEFTVEKDHPYYIRSEFVEHGLFGFNTR